MTTSTSDGGAGTGPLLRIGSAIATAWWIARITVAALLLHRGQR